MNFDLKKPCSNCPFRINGGIRLRPARAREIASAQTANPGQTFSCHKTVKHSDGDEEEYIPSRDEQYCAGAMIYAMKVGPFNQMLRIASRFGWKPEEMLEQDAVFGSLKDMIKAQGSGSGGK